ncbi:MAG: pilus assembly protein PilP [Deltaproteobacteria bacterium]|nr:pilus assembly protein PilP [Deltaproteobacteria bacterium]
MAKRKKKLSVTKKIAIIGGVLIAMQAVYLFVFGSKVKPMSMREAITKAVEEKSDLSIARREQAKIQLALADYQAKNSRLPASLDELVPTYFDTVPIDQESGKPFKYRVDGVRYFIGDETPVTKVANLGAEGDGGLAGGPTTAEEQQALIDSLTDSSTQTAFVYDPSGKRDPFQPFDLTPKGGDLEKTPLERYNIGQLKLTAVLEGFDEPKAIIENSVGKGFTVGKGTKIGTNNGEIVEIHKDKILILETEVDFTGQKKTKTIELRLRTKDEDENARQGGSSSSRKR